MSMDPVARPGLLSPDLSILPAAGRRLWPELGSTPDRFVLYGGTALALRLGHRRSEDFDFFSSSSLDPSQIMRDTGYLKDATVSDQDPGTLVCSVERGEPVQVSFFGGLSLNRVRDPDSIGEPAIRVASLLDLAGTKAQVVQARAAAKDFLDLDAVITRGGLSLGHALGAAVAIFGRRFNPLLTLKALSFFGDGTLGLVPGEVRSRLLGAIRSTNVDELPEFTPRSGLSPPMAP